MSTSANTSSPTSPSPDPDPSSPVISFDTDPLLTTISGIGAPSIRGELGYHRPVSLCHIFEAANLSLSISMSKPLTALGLQYLTIPLQHSSVTSKESLCKHTKALFLSFFSNSPTKQLLLLFLLGSLVETSKSEIVMPSFGDKCKVFI